MYHRPVVVCVVVWLDESFRNTSSEVSTPPSSSNTSRMQNPGMRSPRLLLEIYRSSVPNTADIVLTVIAETFFEMMSSNRSNRSVSTIPSGIGSRHSPLHCSLGEQQFVPNRSGARKRQSKLADSRWRVSRRAQLNVEAVRTVSRGRGTTRVPRNSLTVSLSLVTRNSNTNLSLAAPPFLRCSAYVIPSFLALDTLRLTIHDPFNTRNWRTIRSDHGSR